jgi:hypothetical protein
MLGALRRQLPVEDLPGVSIRDVQLEPEELFDVSFELVSGSSQVRVLGEVQRTVTPMLLEQISPWIQRLKSLRPDIAVALITPLLSPRSQAFCIRNKLNFIDLAGNIYIDAPGKLTLQRTGRRRKGIPAADSEGARSINVFSGRTSRVLRVLLENPKSWTLSDIAREFSSESERVNQIFGGDRFQFRISLSSISKAMASLEEQLWIRRRGTAVLIPEPRRLLEQWAEKYRERYRWRLRSSFQTNNPFGRSLSEIDQGIQSIVGTPYIFSGAIAASEAPFVDIDQVEVFLTRGKGDENVLELERKPKVGPPLRFTTPYDEGVFLYCRKFATAPVVSPIQAYLDLYARGGRDLKQANYLLDQQIQLRWSSV